MAKVRGKRMTAEEALNLYASIMEEVKLRLDAVQTQVLLILAGRGEVQTFVHAEYAYLQLRMICELIALGSIAAHHDTPQIERLFNEWNADVILKHLSTINPRCFPRPIRSAHSDGNWHFEMVDGGLTREELQSIYGRCGNELHRGKLRRGAEGLRRPYNERQIEEWARSLRELLTEHSIEFPHLDRVMVMNLGGTGENVTGFFGEAVNRGGLAALEDGRRPSEPNLKVKRAVPNKGGQRAGTSD